MVSISGSSLPSKKWLAPGMICWSITMPFCVFSFSTSVLTSFGGTTASLSPCTIRREEGEVIEIGRRRDRDESLNLRPAHQELHADPGAEREAGDPAGARFRVDGLRPIERGRRVRQFAGAMVERALAAT